MSTPSSSTEPRAALAGPPPAARQARVVLVAVAVAVIANLVIYALGRAAGGTFRFTGSGRAAEVDAVTVAGFTAIPLIAGLVLAATLARRWPGVITLGLVVAPALALGTILLMTLPVDLDTASTIALALCHVTLVPVTVAALLALRRRG